MEFWMEKIKGALLTGDYRLAYQTCRTILRESVRGDECTRREYVAALYEVKQAAAIAGVPLP